MSRLHFACICLYQVFEYHMEFLETFGCIWSSKRGRCAPHPGATHPERLHKVARVFTSGDTHLHLGATFQSDVLKSLPKLRATIPERQGEVARVFITRRRENEPGATSRSDTARSLPKPGATCRSDGLRSLRVLFLLELVISQGHFGHFIMHKTTKNLWKVISLNQLINFSNHNASSELATQLLILRHFSPESSILDHPRSNPYTHEFSFPLVKKEDPLAVNEVEGLEGQEELCFINNNGSWYKKEPNFQYNNYQQKSYPNNQHSGYPPRNNQQGSYQPQQNPSSGSSAPQESSTDTLLKQILESQTRSEKQVGYELKNLHSKIDGSYNELNNKFSHLASTSDLWTSTARATSRSDGMRSLCTTSRSDSSRATAQGRSRFHVWRHTFTPRSDLPERRAEVAPEAQSDHTRATGRSRSRFHTRRRENEPGATSRSDTARSLPKPGATCRSDGLRSLRVLFLLELVISQGHFGHFIMHKTTKNLWKVISLNQLINFSNHNASSELATQLLILRHFSPERLSEYLHSRCFDIPQNWFDNHLYYNICLRSLENS
ncbi:hypothetical protein IGI04_020354 [Brassica rapa subsp. trilocularis]|uniref:t-SNARE coiled-coil homology domain-containing protein n=1 Tax=Brassica rapa subsp. trilocularis TaxID=1813537 RepID=A0ABQ7MJC5_BRACM|nr:hypothetical protein IGI04_020354 [Brassica rapa subsp. trilocularis]